MTVRRPSATTPECPDKCQREDTSDQDLIKRGLVNNDHLSWTDAYTFYDIIMYLPLSSRAMLY